VKDFLVSFNVIVSNLLYTLDLLEFICRKKTIMTTEQFDFLKDVVASIPDPVDTGGDGEASSSTTTGIISNMEGILSGDEAEAPVQTKKRRGRKR
jgi:hypothetical protein